jgi:hypothetical protein
MHDEAMSSPCLAFRLMSHAQRGQVVVSGIDTGLIDAGLEEEALSDGVVDGTPGPRCLDELAAKEKSAASDDAIVVEVL